MVHFVGVYNYFMFQEEFTVATETQIPCFVMFSAKNTVVSFNSYVLLPAMFWYQHTQLLDTTVLWQDGATAIGS
jgi:hypothetical protein